MNEGLLTSSMKESLEKIVKHCFYCNRITDRIVSWMSIKFVMPTTANLIHPNLAHMYLGDSGADGISGYMDSRNCTTIYGETPIGNKEYDNPRECMNEILDINLEWENLVKESIKLAKEENDYATMVFLQHYLENIIEITKDILTLVDKIEMYEDSNSGWMKFDNDVVEFPIFGE
jgi:ferritin